MPRGQSLSIYALFSGKKRTLMYISRHKGDRYYIQTRHNDLFFPITIFFKVNLKKNWPEKHPIILLKSNYYSFKIFPRF